MMINSNVDKGRQRDGQHLRYYETDVLFSNDTGKLEKKFRVLTYQESNLRPFDY